MFVQAGGTMGINRARTGFLLMDLILLFQYGDSKRCLNLTQLMLLFFSKCRYGMRILEGSSCYFCTKVQIAASGRMPPIKNCGTESCCSLLEETACCFAGRRPRASSLIQYAQKRRDLLAQCH